MFRLIIRITLVAVSLWLPPGGTTIGGCGDLDVNGESTCTVPEADGGFQTKPPRALPPAPLPGPRPRR